MNDTVGDATSSELAESVHRIAGFENGADRTLDGDQIANPLDGPNYKNFADRPLFADAGPSEQDVHQGDLGDCGLLAAMGRRGLHQPQRRVSDHRGP